MISITAQYAVFGTSAAILAVLILAAHLRPERTSVIALALLRAWRGSPRMFAPPLVAALLLASGASLWMATQESFDDNRIVSASLTAKEIDASPIAHAPAAAQIGVAAADTGAARDKAIEALRSYANKIDGKLHTLASIGNEPPSPPNSPSTLPDVDTMIGQLATRLEQAPDDVAGWRMLGWSYANTGDFEKAAKAYEAALTRDPKNSEILAALNSVRSKTTPSSPAPTAPHAD